jgi:hypothetical protein
MLEIRVIRIYLLPIVATTLFAGALANCAAQADGSRPTRVIQMVNVFANIEKTIDAKKNKAGDPVLAKVTVGANLSDGTKVPGGSVLIGHIDSVTPSEKKGDSILVFTFDKVAIKNGKEIPIRAVVVKVSSLASTFGQEKNDDPDANRPAHSSVGSPAGGGVIDHPPSNELTASGPHPIDGLTLSRSAGDATSATLTQAKKNVQLNNYTQLVVSIAAMPN